MLAVSLRPLGPHPTMGCSGMRRYCTCCKLNVGTRTVMVLELTLEMHRRAVGISLDLMVYKNWVYGGRGNRSVIVSGRVSGWLLDGAICDSMIRCPRATERGRSSPVTCNSLECHQKCSGPGVPVELPEWRSYMTALLNSVQQQQKQPPLSMPPARCMQQTAVALWSGCAVPFSSDSNC